MRIDVYSHSIRVTEVLTERDLEAMYSFCKPLIEYGLQKKRGRFTRVGLRTFAASTRNRREFGFHRNQLEDLKKHLFMVKGYPEHLIPITIHDPLDIKTDKIVYKVKSMHTPRPIQSDIIKYVLDSEDPSRDAIIKMVTLQPGGGKALRNSTPVRTPDGWRRIDKLRVGDLIIGDDGEPTKVMGVYPQGKKQLYRITFYDGRTVDACGEHLWRSFYKNVSKHNRWQVRNTLEMKRLLEINPTLAIPLPSPQDGPDMELDIDPWVLGVLIGNGSLTLGQPNFSSVNTFIIDKVRSRLPAGYSVLFGSGADHRIRGPGKGNLVKDSLRHLELLYCKAEDKFIPRMYFEGSLRQRKELLTGLIDTDGYVNGHGTISYCTVSKQLAEDVQYLVRSLGGIARIRTKTPTYTYKGEKREGQLAYNVYIRLPKPSEVVSVPHKAARVNDNNQYAHRLKLRVESIEEIDVDDCTCIAVDNESKLFVVNQFIVTHNTFISQYCFNQMGCRAVIHFKGGYTERWVSDLNDTFEFDEGELLVVRGSKDMVKLMKMALEDKLTAQVIIISTATMRDYIKDYEDSNGKSKKYPIKPIDFYPTLKVGIRINDEFHQEFHNNFRMDLYTHVPKSLALSATMVSSDKFKNKMYEIACPTEHRHDGGEYKVYIGVTEVLYDIDPEIHVRYMGDMGYSHTTYEGSILRHKGILKNYFKIVESTIYEQFVSVREPGQKALVFFATVDMCTLFVKHLERLYPDLDVARYVGSEGDEYEDMVNADITVSTVGSAGTAIDIPNLRCSFMTTALDSRQSNEQALGRTRPLKDWKDITPEFIYFSCTDIDQHTKYSDNKKTFFKGKVLYHNSTRSRYRLTKENNSRW